ncbi:MAG TPA: hypothetical protein VIS71_10150 [Terrimicrobium sp.]
MGSNPTLSGWLAEVEVVTLLWDENFSSTAPRASADPAGAAWMQSVDVPGLQG